VTVLHSSVLTLLHCVFTSIKEPCNGFELYPCFLPCMFVGLIPARVLEEQESELNRERLCNYNTLPERYGLNECTQTICTCFSCAVSLSAPTVYIHVREKINAFIFTNVSESYNGTL
jgi:hypothetical protein